jgi:hypothetical protein
MRMHTPVPKVTLIPWYNSLDNTFRSGTFSLCSVKPLLIKQHFYQYLKYWSFRKKNTIREIIFFPGSSCMYVFEEGFQVWSQPLPCRLAVGTISPPELTVTNSTLWGIISLAPHSVRPRVRPPPSLVIVSPTYGPLPTPWQHSRIPFKFRTCHRLGFDNHREEIALLIKIVHIKGPAKPMYSFNLVSTFTFAGGVWSRWAIKPSNQSQTKSVSLDGELN